MTTMINSSQDLVKDLIGFGVDFAKDEEGNLFICFFAFREEKEIMYGKPFVGFSEILSTKKQRDFQVSY